LIERLAYETERLKDLFAELFWKNRRRKKFATGKALQDGGECRPDFVNLSGKIKKGVNSDRQRERVIIACSASVTSCAGMISNFI
jgi:hypothetical protein